MHPSTKRVLTALETEKNKGITFSDFNVGFRLGARIKDLRDAGYNILTERIYRPTGTWYARYVMLPKNKKN